MIKRKPANPLAFSRVLQRALRSKEDYWIYFDGRLIIVRNPPMTPAERQRNYRLLHQ